MTSITTKPDSSQPAAEATVNLFDNWFDPIETGVRERVREFIHATIEGELDMSLSRPRYARGAKPSIDESAIGAIGHRHGHRSRSLRGSFGRVEIEVSRAIPRAHGPLRSCWAISASRSAKRCTVQCGPHEHNVPASPRGQRG